MKVRAYLALSGAIFGLISILHFVRLATGTAVTFGAKEVPLGVSWVGGFVTLGLAIWGFTLAAGRAR